MNVTFASRHITLVVHNPGALQSGSTPRHRFDGAGGTIGCRGANWILIDRNDRIEPIHCEIGREDGHFCVIDRSGQTRINDARAPLGQSVAARLSEGDFLHVGPYQLTVHLHDSDELPDGLASDSMEEWLHEQTASLFRAVTDEWPAPRIESQLSDQQAAFQALTDTSESRKDLDPLLALEAAERETQPAAPELLDPTHYGLASTKPQANLAASRFEAISGAPQTFAGETTMTHARPDAAKAQSWLNTQSSAGSDPRQLVAPLMEGLGTSLGMVDGQTAYRLLLEAGQALQAAVRGLTALYRAAPGGDDRLALLGRTLQPIEDNPLRLGLNYSDTVSALFANERSVVHLSPKAAVEESLTQAQRHQAAMVQAISASLEALLRAFSPDVLLERFHRYRPEQSQSPEAGEWAWQMYTHYYNELASSRQQGFEKLFWEVFEQAYDRALRAGAQ